VCAAERFVPKVEGSKRRKREHHAETDEKIADRDTNLGKTNTPAPLMGHALATHRSQSYSSNAVNDLPEG
jgi:hypothetical protein